MEKLIVFLDVDGVLNHPETYEERNKIYEKENINKYRLGDNEAEMVEFIKTFNNREDIDVYHFKSGSIYGEIASKKITQHLVNHLKRLNPSVEYVLISSCASMWENGKDSGLLGMRYFNERFGFNFVDFITNSGGNGIRRYNNCIKWLYRNGYADKPFKALIIDDIAFFGCRKEYISDIVSGWVDAIPLVDYEYLEDYSLSEKIDWLKVESERVYSKNPLTNANLERMKKYSDSRI